MYMEQCGVQNNLCVQERDVRNFLVRSLRRGLVVLTTMGLALTPAISVVRAGQLPQVPVPGMVTLVDLGAKKCIPCKMMAPILEDLKQTYAGKLDVEFIDVWQNAEAGGKYGIRVIPTQIFFDAAGKELFRHEGFFAKEDILKTWKQYGVDLGN